MTLKNAVRSILPPTERYYTARTNSIDVDISSLKSSFQESHSIQQEANSMMMRNVAGLQYGRLEYLGAMLKAGPRILVAGWYGAENLGDEYMLRTILDYLPEEALSRTSVLLWDNLLYPRDTIDLRVSILHYPQTTWELEQLIDTFDVLVWGGGAIIDETQYDSNPYNCNTGNLFIRLSMMAIARNKPVYCLGLSTNASLNNPVFLDKLQTIINLSSYFELRDPHSKEALRSANIDCSKIELNEDLVFANKELARSLEKNLNQHEKRKCSVGVAALCIAELENHYAKLLDALSSILEERYESYDIKLIPFLNDHQNDVQFYSRLLESLPDKQNISISPYSSFINNSEMLGCSFCICYKYHAALFSYYYGIPGLTICADMHPHYRNKMIHLTELFSCEDDLLYASQFEKDNFAILVEKLDKCKTPTISPTVLSNRKKTLDCLCNMIASDRGNI